jgi:YebC/PmpR family DNA-binding regulatory protein
MAIINPIRNVLRDGVESEVVGMRQLYAVTAFWVFTRWNRLYTEGDMLKSQANLEYNPGKNHMAGHSKWANIKHKKAATDAKRGKIWTRLIKEITVAARLGGGEMSTNPRLRLAVEKAADANMPKDNVTRAISRGTGGLDGANYEEIRYEGYGINGAAVLVDCMTDNRVRTVAEVRHAFSKFGGNMGSEGSVAFLFKHCGQFLFAPGTNEDALMEAALEAGAEDVITDDEGGIEVLCDPNDFSSVKEALEKAGYKAEMAEIVMKPTTETVFAGDDAIKMQKLLDALENLDDVQEIYTNAIIEG